jgi:uncharacterized repeat protein (TIGR01451 family)
LEGGKAVRRIYSCVLLLVVGGVGLGLMQGLAQPVVVGPNERPIAESIPVVIDSARPTTSGPARIEIPSLDQPALPALRLPEINEQPKVESVAIEPTLPALPEPPAPSALPTLDPAAIPAPPRPAPRREQAELPMPPAGEVIRVPGTTTNAVPPKNETPPRVEPTVPPAAPAKQEPTIPAVPAATPSVPPTSVVPVSAPKGVAPTVSVEVVAPEAVGVGQAVSCEIIVRNLGPVAVHQVRIEDELPKSLRYLGGEPLAEVVGERMQWVLGTLESGAEKHVKVSAKAMSDGDWRLQPVVTFSAHASPAQVRITKPRIAVTLSAPESAAEGEDVPFQIQISNSGSGPAHQVVLRAQLSEGLQHSQGSVIEAELPNIAAGETRSVTLKTQALHAGPNGCALTASADGGASETSARANVQITPPTLHLKLGGPGKALVRAEPTFTVEVRNTATAPSQPVQAAAAFPEGLEFVSASDGGRFEADKRIVTWDLGQLPANAGRSLTVKAKAVGVGNWAVRALARCGNRAELKSESVIQIEGVPALTFEVVSLENPVELGKDATYEVRVINQGTCPCTNVRLVATLSDGLSVTGVTGPVANHVSGTTITLEPIARLAVKADAVFRIKVKATQPGDQRCKVELACEQLKHPVVKEESTSFYQP